MAKLVHGSNGNRRKAALPNLQDKPPKNCLTLRNGRTTPGFKPKPSKTMARKTPLRCVRRPSRNFWSMAPKQPQGAQ